MNATSIEWVKNPDGSPGYTWNPITGCLNGCPYCYARKLANGRLKSRYLANKNYPVYATAGMRIKLFTEPDTDPFYPRFWQERILDFTTKRIRQHYIKPMGIFVCDMGELFGDWIPEDWQEQVFWTIKHKPQHRFYLLTKQPQNLIKFSPFPDNCWVGVSIEGGGFAIPSFLTLDGELGDFYNFKAKVKFISFEPLLYEPTPFALYRLTEAMLLKQVNWVIIGAQTKPYKPPKMKWIDEIVAACDKAKVPVFLKNNLMPLVETVFGRENYLSPILTPDGDLRQEIPKVRR